MVSYWILVVVSSNLPLDVHRYDYYMIKTTPLVSSNLPLDVHRYNYCMIKTTPLVSSNLPLDVTSNGKLLDTSSVVFII
jgi:hypothetical protein